MSVVFIECSACLKDVPINPQDLLSFTHQKDKSHNTDEIINCPTCHEGIVSYIDDGDEQFWGCGECGKVWLNKNEIKF